MDLFDLTTFLYRPLDFPLVLTPVAFIFGAIVGSLLNVCILRIPVEKSIFWPGSHCGSCLKPVRWFDNVPILSYWRLGGRCRHCGAEFAVRYFWIGVGTAVLFAVVLYWDLTLPERVRASLPPGAEMTPVHKPGLLLLWLFHVTLLSFLIVASFIDLDHHEIPLRVTIPGTIIGLLFAPWVGYPWPLTGTLPDQPVFGGMNLPEFVALQPAAHFWPYWAPPPAFTPYGSVWMGIVTAVVGALVGTGLVRAIRGIFSWAFGKEAMGLGDADLLMMIGAFLGWQVVFLSFGWGVVLLGGYALIFGFIFRVGRELPFGPALALGAVLTVWAPVPVALLAQRYLFDGMLLVVLGVLAGVLALIMAFLIRMLRLVRQA
ncbi:MAG TPA: prepilin peptidase [Gemmatales bacterium]|nr:prepilin peptidase [Gemmatales bacterium]